MLFGQSVFQSMLTRLKEERGEEDAEEEEAGYRLRGLGAGFTTPDTATDTGSSSSAGNADAYFAFMAETSEDLPEAPAPEIEEPPPEPVIPPHLLRLTTEEIAEELAITAADTVSVLAEKRRLFAKANHPDGVPPDLRDNANIRMKTANLLIDKALKDAKRQS